MPAPHTAVSAEPLDLARHLAAVSAPRFGAVATFLGQVRDHDPDVEGEVVALEYSAHPDAAQILARIAAVCGDAEASRGHEVAIAVTHRVGRLEVGDPAIIASVASAHRAAAFEVCRLLVERVKAELPVWKRQLRADGSHNWVGMGG